MTPKMLPNGSTTDAVTKPRKLVRALPDTFRADAQAAADAVVIDPARWGERDGPRPPLVDVLQRAVVARRKVRLTYSNRTREQTIRLIDPWGLADKDDVWYLVAGTENGQRTFRVDRVLEAVVTDLAAERPDNFALPQEWERIVDEVELRRGGVWATVLIGSGLLPVLRKQFGRQCEVDGRVEDGRVRVRVQAPTATMIAQYLAGWGALVEVAESETVQAELARIGAELAERYGTSAAR